MPAADCFVPLALWLQGPVAPVAAAPDAIGEEAIVTGPVASEVAACGGGPHPVREGASAVAVAEALRDVRLFRARAAEALETATATLVRELAYAVLGRDLQLAPADVATIAARILAEHPAAQAVALRHAPGDVLDLPIPAIVDPALAPGDVIVVFPAGDLDARLGVRLEAVLEAWS